MSDALPTRTPAELATALRVRADALTGTDWEVPATAAMMREAADMLTRMDEEADRVHALAVKVAEEVAKLNAKIP
jgi:transposase